MRRQLEGSAAVAEAVARCRPEVVCAYPISPQTHIIERIGRMVRQGELAPCAFVNVESELSAMSVCIGASATGARAYTATASQGLLLMTEAVYNAAGLGLPIVMTLANRAVGAPINIWNDHSDAMAVRDAGSTQLFAETNQEAADLHVQAFRLAEQLSVPVMVNMDGFVLTHAVEEVDLPDPGVVDAFLPPYVPRQLLDPDDPMSIGAMVGPEAFTEVRYLARARQAEALEVIPRLSAEYEAMVGRSAGGLVRPYRCEDAEVVVVVLGSMMGTLEVAVDAVREAGRRVGALSVRTFRPFPTAAVKAAVAAASRVVVLERALSVGSPFVGPLSADVAAALAPGVALTSVVAGLGGRPVGEEALSSLLADAVSGALAPVRFLELDEGLLASAATWTGSTEPSAAPIQD